VSAFALSFLFNMVLTYCSFALVVEQINVMMMIDRAGIVRRMLLHGLLLSL